MLTRGHHEAVLNRDSVQLSLASQVAVSKAILTAADITARIERLEGFGREFVGAAIVARAWVDDAYRARLLDDGITAAAELGAYTGGFQARGGIAGLHTLNMWVFRSLGDHLWRHGHCAVGFVSRSLQRCMAAPAAGMMVSSKGHTRGCDAMVTSYSHVRLTPQAQAQFDDPSEISSLGFCINLVLSCLPTGICDRGQQRSDGHHPEGRGGHAHRVARVRLHLLLLLPFRHPGPPAALV